MSKWQRPPTINPITDAYQNTMGITVHAPSGEPIKPGEWLVVPGSVWADAEFRATFRPVPEPKPEIAATKPCHLADVCNGTFSPNCVYCRKLNGLPL